MLCDDLALQGKGLASGWLSCKLQRVKRPGERRGLELVQDVIVVLPYNVCFLSDL